MNGGRDMDGQKIKVAVLTGGHPYDVPNFNKLLRSIPDADFYIQAIEEYCTDLGGCMDQYDVVLFYNMTLATPQEEAAWNTVYHKAIDDIGERGQGIFVLHHAVLAFPDWPVWDAVTGIARKNFSYDFDQNVKLHVEDSFHPITKGLKDWEMTDEVYLADNADEGSHILITTDHPASMKTLGWARQYKNSRVFCYQSGHDRKAYENETFREIISRGVQWCGKRI